jgi:hypothetical protein
MAADLAHAVALYGQSFEWHGAHYACVERDRPTMRELEEAGGFVDGVDKALVVPKRAFAGYNPDDPATFPADGNLVNCRRHQVKRVAGHKDPAAAQLILYIGSVDA